MSPSPPSIATQLPSTRYIPLDRASLSSEILLLNNIFWSSSHSPALPPPPPPKFGSRRNRVAAPPLPDPAFVARYRALSRNRTSPHPLTAPPESQSSSPRIRAPKSSSSSSSSLLVPDLRGRQIQPASDWFLLLLHI
ncbi:hypothetical protein EJB05_38609, partial [Eragrostis curvula]